ncbi:MAG: glutamyl-tRNA reductase [Planctomycetaceae bacterium]|jgi:glutamyl-tRNA reductase|nr:glutamyl-tRNA reductase [Planctomycetaceae bacterium]
MGICVIGLNYKSASIEIREQLAFSNVELRVLLSNWSDNFVGCEVVLLSTCNRTEVYISSEENELPESERVIEYLLRQKSLLQSIPQNVNSISLEIPETENANVTSRSDYSGAKSDVHTDFGVSIFLPHLFRFEDLAAVEHLFSVVSSLDSMLLGEVQILSQVKSAYQAASEAGTVGAIFNRVFQTALRTAKQVANETELHKHRVSLPSIAVVDFALQVFERLDDKRVLVFGAGEMGRETLQYLCAHGAKNITIANRSIGRAKQLSEEFGGEVGDWGDRFDFIAEADLVVTATGSADYVVTLAEFRRIDSRRGNRVLFVLDLAVPRDFDPLIGGLSNVYLYSIDDLQETCLKNRAGRDREVPKANQIVLRNANDFMYWLGSRPRGVVIQKLREQLGGLMDIELERLFNKLSELGEREREEISYSFERFIGKVLHLPLSSLYDEQQNGEPHHHRLLTALARLFRLNNE